MKTQLVYEDDAYMILIPDEYVEQLGWLEDDFLNIDLDLAFSKLEISKDELDKEESLDIEGDEDF